MWYEKKLQDLTIDEYFEIMRLRVDTFVVEQNRVYHEVDDNDPRARHVFYRDEESGRVQAYARIYQEPGSDQVTFGRVVTSAATRGQGMGAVLLTRILQSCAAHWPHRDIVIEAQQQVTGFYERVGFVMDGEPFIFNQTPHVRMVRVVG